MGAVILAATTMRTRQILMEVFLLERSFLHRSSTLCHR
jgi:hypothetical protein